MAKKNSLSKNAKSDRAKWIITFLAVILLSVGVLAAITQGFTNWDPYGWFSKPQIPTQEAIEFAWHEYEGEEDPAPISPMYGCSFEGELLRSNVYSFDIEVINADGTSERNMFVMGNVSDVDGKSFMAELKSSAVNGYMFFLISNADFDMTSTVGFKTQEGCNVIATNGSKDEMEAVWSKVIFHGYQVI